MQDYLDKYEDLRKINEKLVSKNNELNDTLKNQKCENEQMRERIK